MKALTRFEYARLADALAESGLVDQKALQDALQFSGKGGPLFPEALVEANLVTDWELSRVVCEVYGLPFLPLDIAHPDTAAFEGLDPSFLQRFGLVPLGRFGKVLTVAMPAMVEAEVLKNLGSQAGLKILPVVGTVRQNRLFLQTHFGTAPTSKEPAAPLPSSGSIGAPPSAGSIVGAGPNAADGSWSSFFDEADAAVLLDLQAPSDDGEPPPE